MRAEVERELEIEEIRRVAREAAAQAEAAQAKLDQTQAQINEAVRKAQALRIGRCGQPDRRQCAEATPPARPRWRRTS